MKVIEQNSINSPQSPAVMENVISEQSNNEENHLSEAKLFTDGANIRFGTDTGVNNIRHDSPTQQI